ncbi:hypothetical protein FJ872_10130 [Mesorhizobium sp. B2-5-9]|uniref:DUF5677 domain-containing protein n=1 Tax=unclassified Mesorhizobium TaxID=325217 RepID=UPI00112DA958|nr:MULTISPECIES: DUF5677 domain-containing protein [unclassified Mesorhizobium]TPK20834.1 hypothetical protein FJ872_10130 [Mesorhizobium sp. B2-5-9]TPK82457.1 hypothetical protein FJ936_23435 [Mesorhizobium sp. B2-4-13]
MGRLQKALQEQISQLPRLALRPILERKLGERSIALPKKAIDALLDHILSGDATNFTWSDGNTETPDQLDQLDLVFDDADEKEIEDFTTRMKSVIPEVVQSTVSMSGAHLFNTMKKRWEIDGAVERFEIDQFQDRLEERWGKGLRLLRMLLTMVREIGHDAAKRYHRSKSKNLAHRRFVLVRLHVRACQVADEIITLLENGFADGAMARWRTLHEIGVVATLIEGGDEELARRFIDHHVVEVKRQADDWDSKQVPLGYKPIAPPERKNIEEAYADLLVRYGQSFRHDYGWAADHLNDKKPDFKKLQEAADQSGMNTYYKLANFNVHAGARGMFFRLTDMGANMPIAGRSNAGLVEPGLNTAYTLVRITGALLGRLRNLDGVVEMNALVAIRDAIPRALHRADKKLRKDEAEVQRNRSHKRARGKH